MLNFLPKKIKLTGREGERKEEVFLIYAILRLSESSFDSIVSNLSDSTALIAGVQLLVCTDLHVRRLLRLGAVRMWHLVTIRQNLKMLLLLRSFRGCFIFFYQALHACCCHLRCAVNKSPKQVHFLTESCYFQQLHWVLAENDGTNKG